MRPTPSQDGLEVELDALGQYALMEDHTAPQATRRTEQALYLVDHGSGIGGIEVLADNLPISSTAYSWDGEQLLFHSDRLTDGLHALQVRATDNAGNVRTLSFTTRGRRCSTVVFSATEFPPTRSTQRHPFPHRALAAAGASGRLQQRRTAHTPTGQPPLHAGSPHTRVGCTRRPGTARLLWNLYIYRLEVNGQIQMRKMTLMR